ncbi:uncharacterized protein HMPREF1541_09308 [Cyphellophora europaea CBS 101466]|uniref:Uncharacterized protein n=1 Tax=Cyphellophora europaea (strain CBS 101466) TaxID=1220924 RepID=W2S9S7_CYPE1|nr:uncharacterized protein HMPREF1541_09308 [Cyphellophora europaea CBS 101466]ETN45476.1 hypothetical protein HMPREF1541_09308 [Cyphellophora europaea CBS 101466]
MGSGVQQYWLPGYGLSRHIVLGQLHYFLGPSTSVRPYTYQGREGYLINGAPLTKEQVADLRRQSREYEREQSMRMNRRRDGNSRRDADDRAAATEDDDDINEIVIVGRRSPGYSYRPY